jgi:sugar phosphate isomerase/epimerase
MREMNKSTTVNSKSPSRRSFLKMAAASGVAAPYVLQPATMNGSPLNLPIGLQLYTVGPELDSDPGGTLRRVAAAGYKQVELSPLSKVPPADLKKILDDNGLKNPSGHYMLFDLMANLQQKIDLAHQFGQQFMVVTVPWVADTSRFKTNPADGQMGLFRAIIDGLTIDDWDWNAEQFNKIGEQVKKAGLELGYHNHNFEFKDYGSTTGYDEFIRLTDPQFVKLELDCGWMVVAGLDPAIYLTHYPDRYRLLHIKDFKKGFTPRTALMDPSPGAPVPTELGRGAIDYTRIFAAARKGKIGAIFVEQEPPFTEMPALEAIKVDYEYLNKLKD